MRLPCILTFSFAIWPLCLAATSLEHSIRQNSAYDVSSPYGVFSTMADRPADCPPCFNCNLANSACLQYANCTASTGKCSCPPGFGDDDCGTPTCGSLADGRDRLPRQSKACDCKEGWDGVNCNVCTADSACQPLMGTGQEDGAICYKGGEVVKENFQMCDITSRKILDTLKEQIPQATFSCNAQRSDCNFQFWVDMKESFYCALDECSSTVEIMEDRNRTSYHCEHIKCSCIPGRMLCGAENSIDITEFLAENIKGPAKFSSVKTSKAPQDDKSSFSEPAMDDLISNVFGDESIFLKCHSGECLYKLDVPGYEKPVKKINTPMIAGIIASCALLVVAVALLLFFINRRGPATKFGPIHLSEDEEEENARLLIDHKPAALQFKHVSYHLKGRQILSDISGSVNSGELLAIMGASGAGKTSFLDIFARKKKRGTIGGEFWLNGGKVTDEEFRKMIGFVDQEDTMLSTLTVHETIVDSALLRLPRGMSTAAKMQRVEDVERQLGIFNIRHQMIGSDESGRGISGGEKRRVAIACELVTSPSVLFLDEPTSGLDAYNAFNVIECLVTLAKTYERTVIFTIHQPRSNIVALFDQLVLLAQGRAVYSGQYQKCQPYFDAIGYICPPGFNIADYLIDLTVHAASVTKLEDFDSRQAGSNEDGHLTRASSTMAVKSIPSISNVSIDNSVGSTNDGMLRPLNQRNTSVRQQQERQLYYRRNTAETNVAAPSVRSEADSFRGDEEQHQSVKLQKQHAPLQTEYPHDPLEPSSESHQRIVTNLEYLIDAYSNSELHSGTLNEIDAVVSVARSANGHATDSNGNPTNGVPKAYERPRIYQQFHILSRRTWRNLHRNPLLMLTHYAIAIVLAVFIGFLFYGLTDDLAGFQNRLGFFFFVLALFGFSTLTSLTVFAPERLLFVRERAKGYYSPLAYYLAKVVFDIVPLRLIPPIILGCVVYPMTGLLPSWAEFSKFTLFIVLFNLAAATICLFIGICVKNQGVANLLGVLVMLFSLLFGGFLLNHETIPKSVAWLQYLSIYHFAFEGLIVNEVRYLSLIDKQYGLNIEVPGSAILSTFGFDVLALWKDAVGLTIFCAIFLVLGYTALHVLLVEQR